MDSPVFPFVFVVKLPGRGVPASCGHDIPHPDCRISLFGPYFAAVSVM